jgi:hypothetical protein
MVPAIVAVRRLQACTQRGGRRVSQGLHSVPGGHVGELAECPLLWHCV